MATEMAIETVTRPSDEAPPLDPAYGDFDPEFPGSTPEAPYGFKPDGTPYRRRPKGSGSKPKTSSAKSGTYQASDKLAASAAQTLKTVNTLVAGALMFPMPETAAAITTANEEFYDLAYQALLHDPALCKKILGAGTTGGRAGLIMAYSLLAMAIVPTARNEIKAKRAAAELENTND